MASESESKLRAWMANNAYMIVFLGIMFFITWVLLILADFGVFD